MKIKNKLFLSIGALATLSAPITGVVSCGSTKTVIKEVEVNNVESFMKMMYDLQTNMNYVKSSKTSTALDAFANKEIAGSDIESKLGITLSANIKKYIGSISIVLSAGETDGTGKTYKARLRYLDDLSANVAEHNMYINSSEVKMVYDEVMTPYLALNKKPVSGSADALAVRNWIKSFAKTYASATDAMIAEHDFTYSLSKSSKGRLRTLEANADWRAETGNEAIWTQIKTWIDSGTGDFTNDITGIKGKNIIITVPGTDTSSTEILGYGAHYDLNFAHFNKDGNGYSDNVSGLVGLMALLKSAIASPKEYTQQFMFWDAEENGVNGSTQFVKTEIVGNNKVGDYIGYVNLDTIAGGDYLYLGRGSSEYTSTSAPDNANSSSITNKLFEIAEIQYIDLKVPHILVNDSNGAEIEDYPKGVAYPASDFKPFSNAGIEIAGFESTNYFIFGEYGRDGYSQTVHSDFWFPDSSVSAEQKAIGIVGGPLNIEGVNVGGYSRDKEIGWGAIWHKTTDNKTKLDTVFANRMISQIETVVRIVKELEI